VKPRIGFHKAHGGEVGYWASPMTFAALGPSTESWLVLSSGIANKGPPQRRNSPRLGSALTGFNDPPNADSSAGRHRDIGHGCAHIPVQVWAAPEALLWLVLLQTIDADDAHHTSTSQRVRMRLVSTRQLPPLRGINSRFVYNAQ